MRRRTATRFLVVAVATLGALIVGVVALRSGSEHRIPHTSLPASKLFADCGIPPSYAGPAPEGLQWQPLPSGAQPSLALAAPITHADLSISAHSRGAVAEEEGWVEATGPNGLVWRTPTRSEYPIRLIAAGQIILAVVVDSYYSKDWYSGHVSLLGHFSLLAIDAATGRELWTAGTLDDLAISDSRVAVVFMGHSSSGPDSMNPLIGLDVVSGRLLWSKPYCDLHSIAMRDGTVYLTYSPPGPPFFVSERPIYTTAWNATTGADITT